MENPFLATWVLEIVLEPFASHIHGELSVRELMLFGTSHNNVILSTSRIPALD